MTTAAAALPSPTVFEQMQPKIDTMRRERGDRIKAAMHSRDAAVAKLADAKRMVDVASQAIRTADEQLKKLLDVGEEVVIGDQLITLHQQGGLHVRTVKVLGLI